MSLSVPVIVAFAVIGLLGVGLYGVLISRNLIKVVVGLQLLVKGAMIALVLAGRLNGQLHIAASLALTVIVVDTIIAVVGLALAVQIRRTTGTLDVKSLSEMKR